MTKMIGLVALDVFVRSGTAWSEQETLLNADHSLSLPEIEIGISLLHGGQTHGFVQR